MSTTVNAYILQLSCSRLVNYGYALQPPTLSPLTYRIMSTHSFSHLSAGTGSNSAAAAEEMLRKALEDEKEAAKKKKTGWLW